MLSVLLASYTAATIRPNKYLFWRHLEIRTCVISLHYQNSTEEEVMNNVN